MCICYFDQLCINNSNNSIQKKKNYQLEPLMVVRKINKILNYIFIFVADAYLVINKTFRH